MNKKGFTLVELLGVITILSIIMLIAIPNITSVLDKNKRQNYLVDAKKLITQTEYEIRRGEIEKPKTNEILRVSLNYLGTSDVSKDPDGNAYNLEESFVVVVRKDGYLKYYVNLVSTKGKGIKLTSKESLDGENKLNLIGEVSGVIDSYIRSTVGVSGTIKEY